METCLGLTTQRGRQASGERFRAAPLENRLQTFQDQGKLDFPIDHVSFSQLLMIRFLNILKSGLSAFTQNPFCHHRIRDASTHNFNSKNFNTEKKGVVE
jgi:hypothetical protein